MFPWKGRIYSFFVTHNDDGGGGGGDGGGGGGGVWVSVCVVERTRKKQDEKMWQDDLLFKCYCILVVSLQI